MASADQRPTGARDAPLPRAVGRGAEDEAEVRHDGCGGRRVPERMPGNSGHSALELSGAVCR